ncbi:alginate lyase family protein [Robiginitalea sp. M39]|uniref:Alginate lyase family protein n=1 Tax=Robiginitalea aurantiaca TaxID=3056915 RepID=A0ABT7WE15_9FLAO|nr:alginate lyase family protein [Robiginitalea aurantiaca]
MNKQKIFKTVDWNYSGFGKLWTYNLNYFDFLLQDGINRETGLELMMGYLKEASGRKDGVEPYPTSVRGINWIKFLSLHSITDESLSAILYKDYCRLLDNLEYHLQGNHLLENGFSLLFGALYFRDEKFADMARRILTLELKEQILKDGAHCELSPMYHQMMLYRVLDAYNLLNNNAHALPELHSLLEKTALKMLGWLQTISWKDGSIPFINDAAPGIAAGTRPLLLYGERLGLKAENMSLNCSGYRKYISGDFEVLFDACPILPTYQPGHTHADTLQVLLRYQGSDILVDTGTSTYEKTRRRQLERSTVSHNTVVVNNKNSSQVWGGFRVGKRAEVSILEEDKYRIKAEHYGYSHPHRRTLTLCHRRIIINDEIKGRFKSKVLLGHLHFPPGITPVKIGNSIRAGGLSFEFTAIESLDLSKYLFAREFNKLENAWKISYKFKTPCEIQIRPVKG